MSLIREALSAFAAVKPTRNGGREALLKAMLFHTAVSRNQTRLSTHTIDTVAVATASQGKFFSKASLFSPGLLSDYGLAQGSVWIRQHLASVWTIPARKNAKKGRIRHCTSKAGNWALKTPSTPSDSNSLQANILSPHDRLEV